MNSAFQISSYDYPLPEEQIAQFPAKKREESRLLVLDREKASISHERFTSILKFLKKGDCLVVNNSRVFPARIRCKKPTGGKIEFFLLHYPEISGHGHAKVLALYKSSKPVKVGQTFSPGPYLTISPLEMRQNGQVLLQLSYEGNLIDVLSEAGEMPLPPYIRRPAEASDTERYQTVYASSTGSVAAPTAGLHFTKHLLKEAAEKGIQVTSITLHVGYGTFAPIRAEDIREHKIHSEWVEISEKAVRTIQDAKKGAGRIVAVGTTSVRSLEYVQKVFGKIRKFSGSCDLYIMPGHKFRAIDAMITNFHLPRSSLLVLVCAFAGRRLILDAYMEAIKKGYRFYSYGDAMFIT